MQLVALPDRSAWWRPIALGALVLLSGLLLGRLALYLGMVAQTVPYPFGLDYGEGIVWQQLRAIAADRGYGPIDGFPAIVFHYPPAYHLITAFTAQIGSIDQLAAGRLVSFASTLACAALIAGSVMILASPQAPRRAAACVALLAGLFVPAMQPVEFWSLLMRVDMLCTALSFGGFYLGMRAIERPGLIVPAALLFVAAIYTKQTALAAPLAVFAILLPLRPRTAMIGIATGLAVALTALAWLTLTTGGGFLIHILFYNINRLDLNGIGMIVSSFHDQFAVIACGLIGVLQQARRLRAGYRGLGWRHALAHLRTNPADARIAMALTYFAIATPMLGMVAKSGAASNYLIEWSCVLCLFVALPLLDLITALLAPGPSRKPVTLPLALTGLIALQLHLYPGLGPVARVALARMAVDSAILTDVIHAAPGPVLSDDMVALLRAGKPVLWEPAIFAELASKGVWDQAPLLDEIRARRLALIVTTGTPGNPVYEARYTKQVTEAIGRAYPVMIAVGEYTLHLPAGPIPDHVKTLTARSGPMPR